MEKNDEQTNDCGCYIRICADDELDSICLGLLKWQKTSLHSRLKEQNLCYEN